MKKDLMKTNCYDVEDTLIIVGSCLDRMQPEAYKELERISDNIYDVCLEETHINMVITKLIGMISRVKINKIIFASVDKSPHCVQLHYIENEIRKAMDIDNIEMVHYVAVDNKLIEISKESIDSATTVALIIYYSRKDYTKDEVFKMMNIDIKYIPFTKFNTTCEETIGNCLYALYNSNSFEDAIRKTLLMGGDTDTNCAIVGSMAEAMYGIDSELIEKVNEKIPQKFVKILSRARR
jgi:hypothetical protein